MIGVGCVWCRGTEGVAKGSGDKSADVISVFAGRGGKIPIVDGSVGGGGPSVVDKLTEVGSFRWGAKGGEGCGVEGVVGVKEGKCSLSSCVFFDVTSCSVECTTE